jgi:hypothetical protein
MCKQAISLFLLLVLIPLLNLGPSLHRLTCFGLHGDQCCAFDFNVCGCCDEDSGCVDSQRQPSHQLLSDQSHDDCPLCRFFANYNAIKSANTQPFAESFCCGVLLSSPSVCPRNLLAHNARGPPVLSLLLSDESTTEYPLSV